MNSFLKKARLFFPALAALALVAAPAFAFAHNDSSGDVSGTVASETMVAFPLQGTGVFIGAGGSTLVRGATVESVSGSTITARSSWGSAVINWTVDTSGATKFYDSRIASSSLSAVAAGDTVSFAGSIDQSQGAFTLSATAVRDWSKTTPIATSTPPHIGHPFFPVRVWDSIKANFGFGKK